MDGDGRTIGRRTCRSLRRGDTGPEVEYLRTRLRDHGYEITVDDVFETRTQLCVRSFQRANGIAADGVVGEATWAALD